MDGYDVLFFLYKMDSRLWFGVVVWLFGEFIHRYAFLFFWLFLERSPVFYSVRSA